MKHKTITLGILFFIFSASAFSQEIKEFKRSMLGATYEGYLLIVHEPLDLVDKSYQRYLREFGRTERLKNVTKLKDFRKVENQEPIPPLAGMVSDEGQRINVFLGYLPEEADKDGIESLKKEMYRMLEVFAYRVAKENIESSVAEAEKAANIASKQVQKVIQEEADTKKKLDQNAQEKVKLEAALEANAKEKIQLTEKEAKLVVDKEEAYQNLEKIKMVLEEHKKKLVELGGK
jgi:hypothetical protein